MALKRTIPVVKIPNLLNLNLLDLGEHISAELNDIAVSLGGSAPGRWDRARKTLS